MESKNQIQPEIQVIKISFESMHNRWNKEDTISELENRIV